MTLCIDLAGKHGLVAGIANEHALAYGCGRALHEAGARLAITYLNTKAELFVQPLAEALRADIIGAMRRHFAGLQSRLIERALGTCDSRIYVWLQGN